MMTDLTTACSRLVRHAFAVALSLLPVVAAAQDASSPPPAPGQTSAQSPAQAATRANADDRRFFDSVTVSATLNASQVMETPGAVSVIGAESIARRLVENIADLVKFEPGVYVETVPTGVGLNGFNIRGIGGNRVMTQIDGVQTSEQFDFGPFNMHQQSLDLDMIKSAEIVRSAGSSLYGSDALGGVVSFFTKDPSDYLANQPFHAAGKTVYDGRMRDVRGTFVAAGGRERVQGSLFVSYGRGHELSNKGTVETQDASRTAPNDQDRRHTQVQGKAVLRFSGSNVLRGTVEVTDSLVDTQVYSSYGAVAAGPTVTNVSDVAAEDTLQRRRFSIDQTIDNKGGLNQWAWSAYVQQNDINQVIDEVRATVPPGAAPVTTIDRRGSMDFEQRGYGLTLQGRKAYASGTASTLLTFGGSYKQDSFDNFRDRVDVNRLTGATVPAQLILPTKYFPASNVAETGAYVQAELRVGRLLVVPGVRYDRFSLDADENDRLYLDSLNPAPADFTADAVSSKIGASVSVTDEVTLHAQYAGGFRAPSYSAVNNGFTNVLGGYTSLANPDLRPETSDNVDFGIRAANRRVGVGVTGFVNRYDDFIELAQVGFNPATGLLEFQNQNIAKVSITGVELQGELTLSDTLRLRAAYAVIRGNDTTADTDVPLQSVAPDQGTVGLQYTATSRRWGGDLVVRGSTAQTEERAGEGAFVPGAWASADLTAWISLGREVTLRGGVLNLTDATYYEWPNVRGRAAGSATITRYSSPGATGILSLAYGW